MIKKTICSLLCAGMIFTGGISSVNAQNIEINEDDGYCSANPYHTDSFCTYCKKFNKKFKKYLEIDDISTRAYYTVNIIGKQTLCMGEMSKINEYKIFAQGINGCDVEVTNVKKSGDNSLDIILTIKGQGSKRTETKYFNAKTLLDLVADSKIGVKKIRTLIPGANTTLDIMAQLELAAEAGMDIKVDYYIDGKFELVQPLSVELDKKGKIRGYFY